VIQIAAGTRVYLACRPVSMRYGFDGLAAQVAPVKQLVGLIGFVCLPVAIPSIGNANSI